MLRKAILITGFLLVMTAYISTHIVDISKNGQTEWQDLLKKKSIPDSAVKMIKVREFPSEKMEEEGNDIGKALSLGVDLQGNVYIPDWKYNLIHKFNLEGKLISKYGRAGQGPGEFNLPRNAILDRESNIYIEDESRRIQKFNKFFEYMDSIKIFKPYSDYFIAEDGKIVAGYSSRNPKEDHLIEILNVNGSLFKKIGKIKNFKYRSPSHNSVFLASGEHQIFVLWSFFNVFRRYSMDGEQIFDGKLKYSEFDKISDDNDKQMKPDERGSVTSTILFKKIRYFRKNLYTMIPYPRIVIYEFDLSGNMERAFWVDIQEREIYRDFQIIERNGETFIIILRVFPSNRVFVYSIPN